MQDYPLKLDGDLGAFLWLRILQYIMSQSNNEADNAESGHEKEKMEPSISHNGFSWVDAQVDNIFIPVLELILWKLMGGRDFIW